MNSYSNYKDNKMDETKIYLELSDEVQKVMAQKGISLATILQRKGIDAQISYGEIPTPPKNGIKTRDLATIIAVASISAIPLALAIKEFLNALRKGKDVVRAEYYRLEPVIDPLTGEILRDKDGNPIMNKVPQFELSQARPKHVKEEFRIEGPLHLSISFKTETNEFESIKNTENEGKAG